MTVYFFCFPLPGNAQLTCQGQAVDFDAGLPSGWTTSGQPGWSNLGGCGETANHTGGGGGVACASRLDPEVGAFVSTLAAPAMDLSGITTAVLRYRENFQSFAAVDELRLEASADQGLTWAPLRRLRRDSGSFGGGVAGGGVVAVGDGVAVKVDLGAFAGLADVRLRWVYEDTHPGGLGWYAQVDDVQLVCDAASLCGSGVRAGDVLLDGGFEVTGGPWRTTSQHFASTLCDEGSCGLQGAASGSGWAYLGGVELGSEVAAVEQPILLPTGGAELRFRLAVPETLVAGDELTVQVDGVDIWTLDNPAHGFADGYHDVRLDLSTYADGGAHTLRFEATTSGVTAHSTFFVDDVELLACPDLALVPTVLLADATVVEGAGGASALLELTLSHPWSAPVTVQFGTIDGSAVAGQDFVSSSGTVEFAVGETGAVLEIPILGDLVAESVESFEVLLSLPQNAALTDMEAQVLIIDDDINVSVGDASVIEGNVGSPMAELRLSLDYPVQEAVVVEYATSPGSAMVGEDFEGAANTVVFISGETAKDIFIRVFPDNLDEVDETFFLNLVSVQGAAISDGTGQVVIIDDDAANLSLADVIVVEPTSGTRSATFSVGLSSPSASSVTMSYATVDGTAVAGSDYQATNGTLVLPAGTTLAHIDVPVLADAFVEPVETFSLRLQSVSGAVLADGLGEARISDDAQAELSVVGETFDEGQAAARTLNFTVELSQALGEPLTVDYSTADGTAQTGDDYVATSGTLTFAPGERTKEVPVTILDDLIDETDEQFTVELVNPSLPIRLIGTAQGQIEDDDGVQAHAGGPYSGEEGSAILFDAAASTHPNGTLTAYAWDFDNDGLFDEGSSVTASHAFDDNGTYTVAVRVTDNSGETDIATATVTVSNAAPTVDAGGDLQVIEGDSVTLAGASFNDAGSADSHTATVDWGDGTLASATVTPTSGTLSAGHTYLDDGSFVVTVCVSDDDSAQGCDSYTATVANSDPVLVNGNANVNFYDWVAEERVGGLTDWRVESGGSVVRQRLNSNVVVLYSPLVATGLTFRGTVQVNTSRDDDFIGFVLGFQPGDFQNLEAEYLVVDWKQRDEINGSGAFGARGLAISRVHGFPYFSEFWSHVDLPGNGPSRVEELQRGQRFGDVGWRDRAIYTFTIETTPQRVRVFVDDILELDLSGDFDFGPGRFGLYGLSQENVIYSGFSTEGNSAVEGSEATFRLPFNDVGVLDTHTASVDWQDGTVDAGIVEATNGSGTVSGTHIYAEDGDHLVHVCVEDDDQGEACGEVALQILNAAPTVEAGDDRLAYSATGLDVLATFNDPGVLDLHSATVDWGDGTVTTETVDEAAGQGTVAAAHHYDNEGTYTVVVCVEDDDGASGCDRFDVTWLDPRLDLTVAGLSDRQVVRPGETISLGAAVRNVGTLDTRGVLLAMQVPAYLDFVSSADGGAYDATSRTITWDLATLPRDATVQRFATLQAEGSLPFGTEVSALLTVQDDGSHGADLTPLDNQVAVPLVLWNSTSPVVQLSLSSLEADGEVVEGSPITLSAQLHAGAAPLLPDANIEWGDGNVETLAWTATPDGGELAAQHTFLDDGSYRLEVCVSDAAAVEGCSHFTVEVGNLAATLFSDVGLDLTRWQVEAYATVSTGGEVLPEWTIVAGGGEAVQLLNATPSLLYGDLTSFGNTLEGTLRVDPACGDDDFIGFALGFEPGDSTHPDANYVVVDWKKANQGTTGFGLKAYRVLGVPDREDFWTRDSTNSSTPGRVEPMADGLTLGNVGWNFDQSYHVRFEQSGSQLQVWVDDVLEINTIRPFEDGLFAFFNHSQGCVHYSGFRASRAEIAEGSPLDIDMTFRDPGVLDSHSGTLHWGDGAVDAAVLDYAEGAGTVFGSHAYSDDGEHLLVICLDDNGGARGCAELPVSVHNVAPSVQGIPGLSVHRGLATVLDLATFTDPGVLDTHFATIDWGDGSSSDGFVITENGVGSVQGSHAYTASATYTVEVCVTDDDGGTCCGQTTVEVGAGPPVLEVTKIDLLLDDANGDGLAGRGDLVGYQLTVQNTGESDALEVMLSDGLPSWVTLVPGTLSTSQGAVVGTDPIVIDLGTVVPGTSGGAAATVDFVVELGDAIPFELEFLSNQAEVTQQLDLPTVSSDDPDTQEPGDATLTALAPSDATTICEVEPFDGPLSTDWIFTYLGDGNDGDAQVTNGRLRLTGNGSSLFHDGDHGSFVYQELTGNDDFRVEVEVTGFPLDQSGDVRKTALMLRSGTGAYDPRVMVTFVPHFPDPSGTGVQFDFRALIGDPGAEVANTVFAVPLPARLAIEKRGDRYTVLFSTDGGTTWRIPTGVPHQGTVEIDLGPTILAGMAVSSYDSQTLFTAELDDFAVCRPNDGLPLTPVDVPCDPDQPIDLVYLLDLSGSMTADFPDGAAMLSRLEAAQLAISEIHGQLTAAGDGSRAALITFAGFRTPEENLASGAVVVSGLTDDLPAVANLVDAFQVADIQSGDTSPLAIALATARELLQTEADETHQQAIVLLTDGIPNIDAAGRGPDGYELDELQALSLDDGRGRFRPWSELAWSGGFNGLLGTFDGEPLANVMAEMERAKQSLPTLRIYGLGLEGDGTDLGTFNGDLLEYGAHVTGARAFSVGDTATLLAATDALWANLRCEDLGSGVLGDRVWYDVDGDGTEDAEEPGLGDVTVQLYDGHGFRLPFTTTGAAGVYSFDQLTAGTYVVEVHPGSLPTDIMLPTFDADGVATPDWVEVTLADGETNLGLDFGYTTDDDGPPVNLCNVDTFEQAPVDPSWTLTTLGDADVVGMEIVGGELQLTGNGSSLFNLDDNGALAYQTVTGDLRVEVEITGFPVDQGGQVRKACLMLRSDLAVRGPRAMACFIPHLQGDGGLTTGLQFHYRDEAGVTDDWANLLQHIPLPMRFAIERQGDHLTVQYSRDHGATWVQPTGGAQGEVDIVLPPEVLVGPVVVSYDPAVPVTAAFDDFAVCPVDGGQAP